MDWDFFRRYRDSNYSEPNTPGFQTGSELGEQDDASIDEPVGQSGIPNLDYENMSVEWQPIPLRVSQDWRATLWQESPQYFIDGKDVGETVFWLRSPQGYPIAIRLSEIGAIVVKVEGGICHRKAEAVERVISMVADFFPWEEVEDLSAACLKAGYRLLPAKVPRNREQYFDPEEMRKAAQNRSNDEMGVLEEALLAQVYSGRAIVDGRLEPRSGGIPDQNVPVVGVIKTHSKRYLHDQGMRVLHALQPTERTPLFTLPFAQFPVVSWYLRLTRLAGSAPNHGIVRVELPLRWFEQMDWLERKLYVAQLSKLLVEYRCREASYKRAAISLHPIVRAEELLGALFTPWPLLAQRFSRMVNP